LAGDVRGDLLEDLTPGRIELQVHRRLVGLNAVGTGGIPEVRIGEVVTGEFDGTEDAFGLAVVRNRDDGLIRRLLLTAGAVLGIRAVELGVFLDDRVGLPFAGVLLGIEQRTRSRIGDLRIIARAFALGAVIGGFARRIGWLLPRIVRPGIVGRGCG